MQHNSMPTELDCSLDLNSSTYNSENVFRTINHINTKKHFMIPGAVLESTVLLFFYLQITPTPLLTSLPVLLLN